MASGSIGFWREGLASHVVDPASIMTSRRRRRQRQTGSTARPWSGPCWPIIVASRGCAMRQVPRPEADDRRQGSRALKTLTAARVGIVNRIKGLLFAQGVSSDAPRRRDRRAELEPLRTGDRRPLPPHLKRRIVRESDRRELLLEHIKAVKAECDALLAAAQQAALLNPATMLIELKGIGPEFATVLWQEG
jgi:transposase